MAGLAAGSFLFYFTVHPSVQNFSVWPLLSFLAFSLFFEILPLPAADRNPVRVSGILYFAAFLLFGLTPLLWIVFLAVTLSEILQGRVWYRAIFNVSQLILAYSIGGIIYSLLYSPVGSLWSFGNVVSFIVTTSTIFAVSHFLLSGIISLSEHRDFLSVWKGRLEGIFFHLFVNLPIGVLVALIYRLEPGILLVFVFPFAIAHYALRVQNTNRELDKKIRELSLLFEASHYLGTSLSLKRALQVLLDVVERIIPCERAQVFLLNAEDGEVLLSLSASNQPFIAGRELKWKQSEGAILVVPQKGYGMIVDDSIGKRWRAVRAWDPEAMVLLEKLYANQESSMNVPLQLGDRPLGFLEVTSPNRRLYTEEDLKLLSTLANVAAVAIQNAYLYEDTLGFATKDGLTGLYNHRLLQELLDKEVAKASRERFEISFILFDIDHFKKFNDQYGHRTGDLILKEIARIAEKCIREGDIVARYGGEEFGIILPHTSKAMALEVAERLRKSVENADFAFLPQVGRVTISLGIACLPHDAGDKPSLIEAADSALYFAKSLGRNQVISFTRKIKARSERERILGVERLQSFLMLKIARMLANFLDVREGGSPGRTVKVATWVTKVAKKMKVPLEEISVVRIAALLHDLGKIAVGKKLLRKRGPLSQEERDAVRLHPEIGGTLVGQFPIFQRVSAIIAQHQEHYDGKGYPVGLSGSDIHLGARIISVVDAYFSMLEDHAFRKAFSLEKAKAELEKGSGTQFDPDVVKVFLELLNDEVREKVSP